MYILMLKVYITFMIFFNQKLERSSDVFQAGYQLNNDKLASFLTKYLSMHTFQAHLPPSLHLGHNDKD